jgi:hypothetical protein
MLAALVVATAAVSPGCAAEGKSLAFTLEPSERQGTIRASFRETAKSNWSTDFPVADLQGLDFERFRAAGKGPVRFAIVREAGRLDCAGEGGRSRAAGSCTFSFDRRFALMLDSRGIGRPNEHQQIALMAVDARAELVAALGASGYPAPDVDKLIALSAVGVSRAYIAGLANIGYRPDSLDRLVEFRALQIDPEFIRGFGRVGYEKLAAQELVELRALDITPEFIAGFQKIGYRRLPISKLVELKALDVTPELIAAMAKDPDGLPPTEELSAAALRKRHR